MAISNTRSTLTRFWLGVLLICSTLQAQAASEAPGPIIDVQVYSPLGLSTFQSIPAHRLDPYTFTASWEIPTGGPTGSGDLYFGILSTDDKTAYTWTLQDGRYVLIEGMHAILKGVNLNTPMTYSSSVIAGGDLRLTIPASVKPGMYLIFALAAGADRNAADPGNWIQIETKPLFVQ